jgi:hypothetical protein
MPISRSTGSGDLFDPMGSFGTATPDRKKDSTNWKKMVRGATAKLWTVRSKRVPQVPPPQSPRTAGHLSRTRRPLLHPLLLLLLLLLLLRFRLLRLPVRRLLLLLQESEAVAPLSHALDLACGAPLLIKSLEA